MGFPVGPVGSQLCRDASAQVSFPGDAWVFQVVQGIRADAAGSSVWPLKGWTSCQPPGDTAGPAGCHLALPGPRHFVDVLAASSQKKNMYTLLSTFGKGARAELPVRGDRRLGFCF